jgi:hypothetical protein
MGGGDMKKGKILKKRVQGKLKVKGKINAKEVKSKPKRMREEEMY